MLISLLGVSFILLLIFLNDWINASVIWMLLLVIATEALSQLHILNTMWVVAWWALVSIITCAILIWKRKRPEFNIIRRFEWFKNLPRFYKFLVWFSLGIIVVTFFTGITTPPNNPDAMSYHLARVMHWIQNGSVAFYPTNIIRQDIYPPAAEYIAAHVLLLTSYDPFINLIQWFSMLGSLIIILRLTKLLGGDKKAQILSLFFAVTTPIALLESNSAQNDYVATYWLLIFIYLFLKNVLQLFNKREMVCASIALGLGVLTKGFVPLYAVGVTIPFTAYITEKNWKRVAVWFFVVLMTVLLVNAPFYIRNMMVFGTPWGDSSSITLISFDISILKVIMNFFSQVLSQFLAPLPAINNIIKMIYYVFISSMSLLFPNPTMWNIYITEFLKDTNVPYEDIAKNGVQMILLGTTWYFFISKSGVKKNLVFGLVTAIFLLNFFSLWSLYAIRYYVPIFLASTPLIVDFFNNLSKRVIRASILVSVIVWSVVCIIANAGKPFITWSPFQQSIFTSNRQLLRFNLFTDKYYADSFIKICNLIRKKGYKNIGVHLYEFYFEYPYFKILNDKGNNSRVRIEHVDIINRTAKISYPTSFNADVYIVCDQCSLAASDLHKKLKKWAHSIYKVPDFTVYGK